VNTEIASNSTLIEPLSQKIPLDVFYIFMMQSNALITSISSVLFLMIGIFSASLL
jgi:hypothetical protein